MEGISGNGSVIVGYFDPGRGFNKPGEAGFTLSSLGKFEVLVIPKSPSNGGFVEAVSADGSVVVGWYQDLSGRSHAVRWKGTTKSQDLGGMSKLDAYPKFVSANGSIVVGTFHAGTFDDGTLKEHVFRWEEPGRVQDLGTMDGPEMGTFRNLGPGTNVFVDAISSDGSVIVGRSIDASGTIGIYRWTVGGGVQHLGNLHAPNLELWPTAVSDDGSVIVGKHASADCR